VALVPTLSGAGPAGFVRRLAEVLEPRRPVHIVVLDTRYGAVEGESPDGPTFSYSAGSVLDPVLHLSVLEHLASRASRIVFLDFTPPDGNGDVPRTFRLRNPSVVTINAGWRRYGKGLDASPPFALPPPGEPGPVSPAARDSARARLGVPDGATAVILLDVLDTEARAYELVQAAAQLEPQGGWFFVIAGDGPLRPFLCERVSSLRLACSRVVPSSSSPENDLAAADILCAPAGPPGNLNVLLQALALGIPTVAPASTVRPLGLEGGVLALDEPCSAPKLAAALLSLAALAARERLSDKAIAAARSYLERHDLVGAWRDTIDHPGGKGV
jgi:glycosyltransferase involved in cell wall biosynthesis